MMCCVETLGMARLARAIGDAGGCLSLSEAAERQALDEREYDAAFLAACVPARMYLRRCEPALAVAHYRNAQALALSHGLSNRLGEVAHDLYIAARDAHSEAAAREYYGKAAETYLERRDPRVSGLLADRADAKFTANPSRETAANAVEHWRALPCTLPGDVERFFAGCNLMVAAAWLGWERRYREGLAMVEDAFVCLPSHEGAAAGLTDAATGALKAEDYPTGARLAEGAVRIARERGEGIVEEGARGVLSDALAERSSARQL